MDRAIFTSIFSFASGILVASFVFISPIVSIFLILVAFAVLLAEKIYQNHIGKEVLLVTFALIAFGLGTLRYAVKDFHELVTPSGEGIVVSEPEQRDNATRFVLRADNGEKVLVSAGLYEEILYGDRVRIEGKLERPGMLEDFDYAAYLSKDDIYWTMGFAKTEVVLSGHGQPIKAGLLKIKKSFVNKIRETFAEPYASLLAGLIVAGRDAMPKNILEEFRRAGIIHIVVLSGYNITIIADFLRRMFEKLFLLSSRTAVPQLASGASIAGILLFVIMTGAEATVVRAAIMVLTVIAAKMLGRKYSAPRALLLAGTVMLIHNPKILVFDASFQLSFLATLALIYVVPIVEKYLEFITERWELRMTVTTTIATQVTVLPLLVYSVGDFSLVSLPANVLVLLIIPYTMLLGFLAAVSAYIGALVAMPLSYLAYILLWWILGVSSFLGNLPFATIAVPHVSAWMVILVYLVLITFVWRWRSFPRKIAS